MTDIYNKYDFQRLAAFNLGEKLKPLFETRNYYIRPEDGRIAFIARSLQLDGPWIYVRPNSEHNCVLWHKVMFDCLDVFPEPCLKCWKVVVRPRTLDELFQLLELQEKTDFYCKCGIEERDTVPALYGGYFYCSSKEEGLEVLDTVRKMVADEISPEIPVILKRYCTEYELRFGPSDEIEQKLSPYNAAIVDAATQICAIDPVNKPQPKWIKDHVFMRWMLFAYERGDMTVLKFNDGKALIPPSKTYEKEN